MFDVIVLFAVIYSILYIVICICFETDLLFIKIYYKDPITVGDLLFGVTIGAGVNVLLLIAGILSKEIFNKKKS